MYLLSTTIIAHQTNFEYVCFLVNYFVFSYYYSVISDWFALISGEINVLASSNFHFEIIWIISYRIKWVCFIDYVRQPIFWIIFYFQWMTSNLVSLHFRLFETHICSVSNSPTPSVVQIHGIADCYSYLSGLMYNNRFFKFSDCNREMEVIDISMMLCDGYWYCFGVV